MAFFSVFSKVIQLIVLLRDPHFHWQGWQTLWGGSAHRSQSQSTHRVDQLCLLQHQNPTWKTWDDTDIRYFVTDGQTHAHIFLEKKIGDKNDFFLGKKIFALKKRHQCWAIKISVLILNFGSKKILRSKNLGQAKCWSKKFKSPKRLGPKSLVKIGSVIAEIFLSWTNVPRTVGI